MNLDDLKFWLKSEGFKFEKNNFCSSTNRCEWIAYRITNLASHPCDCNESDITIAIEPNQFLHDGVLYESAQVELCAEKKFWFRLKAYALKPQEIVDNLAEIEAMLVNAWNAASSVVK